MRLLTLAFATPLLVVTAALALKQRSGDLRGESDAFAEIPRTWPDNVTPSLPAVQHTEGVGRSRPWDRSSSIDNPTKDRLWKRITRSEGTWPSLAEPELAGKLGGPPEKIRRSREFNSGLRIREITLPGEEPDGSTEEPPGDAPEASMEELPGDVPERSTEEPQEESPEQLLDSEADISDETLGARGRKISEAWAKKTPEERAAFVELREQKRREALARKTPEEKAAIEESKAQKISEAWAKKTPEERAAIVESRAQKMREAWARKTPEERAAITEKGRNKANAGRQEIEPIGNIEPASDEQEEADAQVTDPTSNPGPMASTAWDNLAPKLAGVAALPLAAIPFLQNAGEGLPSLTN